MPPVGSRMPCWLTCSSLLLLPRCFSLNGRSFGALISIGRVTIIVAVAKKPPKPTYQTRWSFPPRASSPLLPGLFRGVFRGNLPSTFAGKTPWSFPRRSKGWFSFLLHTAYERSVPMTFVSVAEAARHLGIDVKTLRRWLADAQLPLQSHPYDGRKKGMSLEHLQVLARLHQRILASLPPESLAPEA